ncbi:MAG TPA: hypothetical protein VGB49_06730 [Caulobacteraceae bacterium]
MTAAKTIPLCLALVLSGAAAPAPAAAADLIFRPNRQQAEGLLGASAGKAYWVMLAECAGFYGALANREDAAGRPAEADGLKATGVGFWTDAVTRLRADRSLDAAAAAALAEPYVARARTLGEQALQRPVPPSSLQPATAMQSTCTDLRSAYAAMRP